MRRRAGMLTLLLTVTVFGCDGLINIVCPPRGVVAVAGSGVEATETRDLGNFNQIQFLGAGRIEVTIGELQPLELRGDDNLLPLMQTTVTGGVLVVRSTQPISPTLPLVITATVPNMAKLVLSGAGDIVITGVNNTSLNVVLSGAGDATLNGQTENLSLIISGAGNAEAGGLTAQHATITVTGAGSADVNVAQTLSVTISGIGTVTYNGDPAIAQDISGLGSLRRNE